MKIIIILLSCSSVIFSFSITDEEGENGDFIESVPYDTMHTPESGSRSNLSVGLNMYRNQIDDTTAHINGCGLNLVLDTEEYVSYNGLNINLFACDTRGNINGLGIGLIGAYMVNEVNGVGIGGIFGLGANTLNGIGFDTFGKTLNGLNIGIAGMVNFCNGVLISGIANSFTDLNGVSVSINNFSQDGGMTNGLLISVFVNTINRINGIAIGGVNSIYPESKDSLHYINGLSIALVNKIDVNGLSLGAVNLGNSWVQIGIFNKGDSILQIGLVNFDSSMKFNFPFVYVRF
jgi:hypothetical protein